MIGQNTSFNKIFQIFTIMAHLPLVMILEISNKNFLGNKFDKKSKALGIKCETIDSNFAKITIPGVNIKFYENENSYRDQSTLS